MSLSCSCNYESEPGDKFHYVPDDYSTLNTTKRKRCSSEGCNKLINIGDICAKFKNYKYPETEIEYKIYGEDGWIPMADKYLCEECADIYFSLIDLGFCAVFYQDDMREMLDEYVATYGSGE